MLFAALHDAGFGRELCEDDMVIIGGDRVPRLLCKLGEALRKAGGVDEPRIFAQRPALEELLEVVRQLHLAEVPEIPRGNSTNSSRRKYVLVRKFNPISLAVYGLDEGVAKFVVQKPAKSIHVVSQWAAAWRFVGPDPRFQRPLADDVWRSTGKNQQQPNVSLVEFEGLPGVSDLEAPRMNGEIAECQIPGTSQVRAFSQGVNPAHQLLGCERLYEIVIATRLVAGNLVIESVSGGQENDWSMYPVFVAKLLARRQSVHHRH